MIKHLMFEIVIQKCNLSTVRTTWSIIKLYKQSFMLLNNSFWKVDLLHDGWCQLVWWSWRSSLRWVVGRLARGGARNCVPQTVANMNCTILWTLGSWWRWFAPWKSIGINYSTARNIIQVWLQDGWAETRRQGCAHNVLVTGAMNEAIQEIALAAPFTTLTSMKQQLLQRFPGVPISLSTVARHLDGHGISTKTVCKDTDVLFERNRPATVEWRRPYGQWLVDLNVNHRLIYVDESGYNVFHVVW